jgi:hypothetical protein
MTWFTETPWPPIVILGIGGCVFLAVWAAQKRGMWLVGAALMVVAAVAVYSIERAYVTEGERVEKSVYDVTSAFQRKDRERVLSFFAVQAPDLRETAIKALELVEFPDGIDVKDVSVRMSNENSRAISRFRANGTVSLPRVATQHVASRWEVTWQKEGSDWKIIEVIRLHPVKDEKMQILEHRSN